MKLSGIDLSSQTRRTIDRDGLRLSHKMTRAGDFIASAVIMSFVVLFPGVSVKAQTAEALLEGIHASIVQMLRDEDATVDVSISGKGHIFTVARVNSSMNSAAHDSRTVEASQIAFLVSSYLNTKLSATKINIIRVVYLSRPDDGRDRIIDVVEFRYGPTGVFEFHRA
jgi:hypothetical protein